MMVLIINVRHENDVDRIIKTIIMIMMMNTIRIFIFDTRTSTKKV